MGLTQSWWYTLEVGVVANPNPKQENLDLGRGKRPKLNHPTVGMRMSPTTKAKLESIAEKFGCTYGGKPWIAGLLEKIGSEELMVVKTPPFLPRCRSLDSSLSDKRFEESPLDVNAFVGEALSEKYGVTSSASSGIQACSEDVNDSAEAHTSLSKDSS